METASKRYDRDWLHVQDDRLDRTLLHQSDERKSRIYVTDGISAVAPSAEEPNDPTAYEDFYLDEY